MSVSVANRILVSDSKKWSRSVSSWYVCSGLPHPGKVLESPWILFISPGKSLKISGRFPLLHRDRIVKLFSLIISTKNKYIWKIDIENQILSPVEKAINTPEKWPKKSWSLIFQLLMATLFSHKVKNGILCSRRDIISGRFPLLHRDRILKLLPLIISTKNKYIWKIDIENQILSPVEKAINTPDKWPKNSGI